MHPDKVVTAILITLFSIIMVVFLSVLFLYLAVRFGAEELRQSEGFLAYIFGTMALAVALLIYFAFGLKLSSHSAQELSWPGKNLQSTSLIIKRFLQIFKERVKRGSAQ